jgi:cyclophilin family peptidyl-prolyl cis-trans isomerase
MSSKSKSEATPEVKKPSPSPANHNKKNHEQLTRPDMGSIATQVITSVVCIALVAGFTFGDFQYEVFGSGIKISSLNCWILNDSQRALIAQGQETVKAKAEYENKLNESRSKATTEENNLSLKDRTVTLNTNFGDIPIKMLDKTAPVTTENFIRLASRGKYDGLIFHRIVSEDSFKVIQGGDPKGDGTGGESAFGFNFKDEIVVPKINTSTSCNIKNTLSASEQPTFVDSSLYSNFKDGTIIYKKGLVAMANSGANTNSSQFFIMFGDTKLQPNYTIFGEVDQNAFSVLDKIGNEVKPTGGTNDGKPDKEIKIEKAILK